MSDSSDGGSSDSGSSSDSSSSDSSWSSDTSTSDNAWTDTSTSDASTSDPAWSGGQQDTTWGDPFPTERPADLPSDLGPTPDDAFSEPPTEATAPAGADAQAAKEAEKAALAAEREPAPFVPPDAPPPPAWTTGQVAPASPPSSPGYSPYPTHPTYPGVPGGPPPTGYPSAYGAVPPSPTGFPAASAMPGPFPGAYPPGYGTPVARRRNNGFAIASLTLALIGIVFCFTPVLSVLAIVFGHLAQKRIKASQGTEGGQGLATAGLVVGYLTLVLSVAFWIFVAVSPDPPPDGDPPSAIAEFGTDPTLDGLARDCNSEDFAACDRLWLQSARGSGYEDYGATCGGRVTPDPGESAVFHERCTERFDN